MPEQEGIETIRALDKVRPRLKVLPSCWKRGAKEGVEQLSRMTKENEIVQKNYKSSSDVERAEARLDEAVARLKRQFAALEAAVEDLKRCHRRPAP
jgi:IS1 family transposase